MRRRVVVGKLGTPDGSIELENAVRGRADTGFGVGDRRELRQANASARKRGEKVVRRPTAFSIFCTRATSLSGERKRNSRPPDCCGQ